MINFATDTDTIAFEFTDPAQFNNGYLQHLGEQLGWVVTERNEIILRDKYSPENPEKPSTWDMARGGVFKCFCFHEDMLVHEFYENLLSNCETYEWSRYQPYNIENALEDSGKLFKLLMRENQLDFQVFTTHYSQDFRFRLVPMFQNTEIGMALGSKPAREGVYGDTSFYCFTPNRLYVINLIGSYQFHYDFEEMANPFSEQSHTPLIAELWSWDGKEDGENVISTMHRCNLRISRSGSLFQKIFAQGLLQIQSQTPEVINSQATKSLLIYPGENVPEEGGVLLKRCFVETAENRNIFRTGRIRMERKAAENLDAAKKSFCSDMTRIEPSSIGFVKGNFGDINFFISSLRSDPRVNYVRSWISDSWQTNFRVYCGRVKRDRPEQNPLHLDNIENTLSQRLFPEIYEDLALWYDQRIFNVSSLLFHAALNDLTFELYHRHSIFFLTPEKLYLVNTFANYNIFSTLLTEERVTPKPTDSVKLMELLSFDPNTGWKVEMLEFFDRTLQRSVTRELYYGIRVFERLLKISQEVGGHTEYIEKCRGQIFRVYRGVKIRDKLHSIMCLMTVTPHNFTYSLGTCLAEARTEFKLDGNENWQRFKEYISRLVNVYPNTAKGFHVGIFNIFGIKVNVRGEGDISHM